MSAQVAKLKLENTRTWTRAIVYALATVVSLWAWGGAHYDVMWWRQGIWGLALVVMTYGGFRVMGDLKALKAFNRNDIQIAVTWSLATAAVCLVGLFAVKLGYYKAQWIPAMQSAKPQNAFVALAGAVLVAIGLEGIFGGILGPVWGVGGVAFLDALTAGVGAQHIGAFLGVYAISFVLGTLCHGFDYTYTLPMTKKGHRVILRPQVKTISALIVGRVVWTVIITLFFCF